MLWLLTVATTAVLVVLAVFVKDIAKVPTVARPAALSGTESAAGPRRAGPGTGCRRGTATRPRCRTRK